MKDHRTGNQFALRHGHARKSGMTPTYQAWVDMRRRCMKPEHPAYPLYGGRGIKVCPEWRIFECFLVDMGERPDGMSLDRINNDGDYEPGNCRWATVAQQGANRSTCVMLTVNGRTQTISEWAREKGIWKSTIRERLCRGWTAHDAVSAPPRKYSPR